MSSELDSLRQRIIELEAENAEVKAKYIKVMDENAEVKAENAKLRCALEEHEARFTRLEQRDKEKTNLIAKMDDDIKEIKQSSANASSVENPNNVVRLGKLEKMAKPSNTSDSTFNSNACKPICTETKSLEDKETDDLLDEEYRRKVSDEIRQRKREKKLQSELIVQESSPAINTSCITDLSTTSTGLVTPPEQVVEESIPKESSAKSAIPCESFGNKQDTPPQKIPYNQKVEQDLIRELLEFIKCHNSTSLPNSISSKHIPDVPVNADLTPGSVLHLAHLFDKAEKTGRKEKLRWYYYSEEYEKKIITLRSENNISDQMARTQIYDEMELYLPGKKREYLRKMTQKAKNIYTLFKGIGIDKIGVVTSSADAISRLTDAQIQNIINLYTDELTKSQKLIGVNNCSHTRGLPAEVPAFSQPNAPSEMISSDMSQANVPSTSQSNPTYDRAYFRNKALDQYPNLYREFSSEKFDYYGITDETPCPLCKLDHDDEEGIEGRYEARSYFIKCEQREIEIVA
ncbi:hypothetical protein GLOIN_2v1790949 [Rhizophagus irregularis DAOM 181602=DAOM 197198]|nr:hypothetical protein GLOIN_2v1790949 [Rhizophagus irregularis DAOM 181602=DAOM 197198]GET67325.1 hypothetical protein GLOIN_2v1790949 [Rhizophagus irregularis DAOM 181602=DAOM 197198]